MLSLSDAWRVLDKIDERDAVAIANALWLHSQAQYEQIVRQNLERPLLLAHMCDGWGGWARGDVTMQIGEHGKLVRRQTRQKHEFLLQRVVVRASTGAHDVVHQVIMPPRSLTLGRTAWNMLQASVEACATPRSLGHIGITVLVFVQDGALCWSTLKKVKGLHALKYDLEANQFAPEDWALYG